MHRLGEVAYAGALLGIIIAIVCAVVQIRLKKDAATSRRFIGRWRRVEFVAIVLALILAVVGDRLGG